MCIRGKIGILYRIGVVAVSIMYLLSSCQQFALKIGFKSDPAAPFSNGSIEASSKSDSNLLSEMDAFIE